MRFHTLVGARLFQPAKDTPDVVQQMPPDGHTGPIRLMRLRLHQTLATRTHCLNLVIVHQDIHPHIYAAPRMTNGL